MINDVTIKKSFSIKDILKASWDLTWENIGKLVAVQLILVAIYLPYELLSNYLNENTPIIGFLFAILYMFIGYVLYVGWLYVCLKVIDRQEIKIADLFKRWRLLFPYFICSILYGLSVGIGLFLLIIPGLFFVTRFSFGFLILVDKEKGPVESLKQSWNIVKGCSWRVFFLLIIAGLISIAGVLIFVVGLLFTVPLSTIAVALAYRQLDKQTVEVIVP